MTTPVPPKRGAKMKPVSTDRPIDRPTTPRRKSLTIPLQPTIKGEPVLR